MLLILSDRSTVLGQVRSLARAEGHFCWLALLSLRFGLSLCSAGGTGGRASRYRCAIRTRWTAADASIRQDSLPDAWTDGLPVRLLDYGLRRRHVPALWRPDERS